MQQNVKEEEEREKRNKKTRSKKSKGPRREKKSTRFKEMPLHMGTFWSFWIFFQ